MTFVCSIYHPGQGYGVLLRCMIARGSGECLNFGFCLWDYYLILSVSFRLSHLPVIILKAGAKLPGHPTPYRNIDNGSRGKKSIHTSRRLQ